MFVFSPSPTVRPVYPATSFLNGLTVPVCLLAPASASLEWAAHEGHRQWMSWQLELQPEVTRGGHTERRTSFVGKKSTTPRRRRIKMELSTATYCEALPIFSLLCTLSLLLSFVWLQRSFPRVTDLPFSWTLNGLREDAAERGLPPPDEDAARDHCLPSGVEAPDLATIKDFFRFYAASSNPRLDEDLMTPDSLGTVAEWFFAGFTRVTGTAVKEEDKNEAYHVSARTPPRCGPKDTGDLHQ